jgi:AraC family transcriptional regulator
MSERTPPTPDPPQTWRGIVECSGLSVSEYSCRVRPHALGGEERSGGYSIVFVRRGVFVRRQARDTVVADANHVLFFAPGRPYHVAHPVSGGDDCTVVDLPAAVARELVRRHDPRAAEHADGPFRAGHALSSPRAARLHYELLVLARRDPPLFALDDLVVELAGEAVRAAYGNRGGRERVRPRHRELCEAAALAVNEHIQAPPRLSDLAGSLGCSPFHLSRVFRRTTGMSLRGYLGRLRSRAVADRLARGARDLTGLALSLGYADHSHMTNAFRREWDMPPSRFRGLSFHSSSHSLPAAGKNVQAPERAAALD